MPRSASDHQFDIRMVPVEDIILPDYQRTDEERQRMIEKMRKDGWDWRKCQVLDLIATDEDMYFALDGGTRALFAKESKIKELPGKVLFDISFEEGAELFGELQSKRARLSAAQKFRAAVMAKRKRETEIVKAVEKAGGFVAYNGENRKNGIQAIHALCEIYDDFGPKNIADMVAINLAAWPDGSGLTRWVMEGISAFIHENPSYNRTKLIDGLSSAPVKMVSLEASQIHNRENQKRYKAGMDLLSRIHRVHYREAIEGLYKMGRARKPKSKGG